jgi:hypothetical protein
VDLTGEWVEALAGFLFLVSAPVAFRPRVSAAAAALVMAISLTLVSARMAAGGSAALACARLEADAVLADIISGLDIYPDLLDTNVHKRVYTAILDGYVGVDWRQLNAVQCAGRSGVQAERRRRYIVDPWGMAYWVRSHRLGDYATITVYSFGPNRNRDAHDVRAESWLELDAGEPQSR